MAILALILTIQSIKWLILDRAPGNLADTCGNLIKNPKIFPCKISLEALIHGTSDVSLFFFFLNTLKIFPSTVKLN